MPERALRLHFLDPTHHTLPGRLKNKMPERALRPIMYSSVTISSAGLKNKMPERALRLLDVDVKEYLPIV